MPNGVTAAIFLIAALRGAAQTTSASCAPTPKKGWVKFLDEAHGFCFWYPPTYTRETAISGFSTRRDRQVFAVLVSSEPRQVLSDDKDRTTITIYLFRGVFDLKNLIVDAPTGYETPPRPRRYGANLFYYYGRGGGGVFYPDMFYFNLHGHVLQLLFDGQYPVDNNSPNTNTMEIERILLSSFREATL